MLKKLLCGGDFNKFTVVKNEDIKKYLTHEMKNELWRCLAYIQDGRATKGKKENTYLVINVDEPYVDEMIGILKRHGHWG